MPRPLWMMFVLNCALWGTALAAGPLEPLTGSEISTAVGVLKSQGKASASTRFSLITLTEPDKTLVYQGKATGRQARVVMYDRGQNLTTEAIVDVQKKSLLNFKALPGMQPGFMLDDYVIAQQLVGKDPRWLEAMHKRGIAPNQVMLDTAGGRFEVGEDGARVMVVTSYLRAGAWNGYARPIEGVLARVDVSARKVLSVTDSGVVPISKSKGEVGADPSNLKPLVVRQPSGSSFTLDGHELRWDRWKLSYSLNAREGLVIHQAGWMEGKTFRPVLYRGSVAEMVVPYGDPNPNHDWRQPFDASEYGLGTTASPLTLGGDVPDHALLKNETLFTQTGNPLVMKNVVAIYERDGGLLFRHMDPDNLKVISRRARELCLSAVSTVGNYDYLFTWVFQQDGRIKVEVSLTGIMATRGIADSSTSDSGDSGMKVAPNLLALHHQHFFGFRLDLDVDGLKNTPLELNTEPLDMTDPEADANMQMDMSDQANPHGNAMHAMLEPLSSELNAVRDASSATARAWVVQGTRKNSLGAPTGYLLVPGKSSPLIAAPEAPIRVRAGFLEHSLWITRFNALERYPAGEYPTNNPDPGGIKDYIQNDEPLQNQDVVLWYTLGITHIPRPEEWPIMNTHVVGFTLEPAGFFSRNPMLP
ncbi:primary-amine oxidase [Deinococcus roseus]|uniref:Amine oxidase n=1 Tax=Deinococcus roseus TaxID=392414 RepID=A0ABQ2CVC6_9DEIO|nr:primary-amine oxidase [Deinococcus roseus]GGJ24563.1 amine oxidase [Deinococcus roseus]